MPGKKAEAPEVSAADVILSLEEKVIAEARAWPPGDNSDAPKHALRQVGQAIGAFRNALETNERLVRP